jgi:glycine oxidase
VSRARIAIIGSGVIGASVADAVTARGAAATLYDMRAPGQGASQASAGVLSPYIEAKPGSPLLALGARSLGMWDTFMDGLRHHARGLDVEYARTGTLEVALTEGDERRLSDARVWLQAEGVAHEWLDGSTLQSFAPTVNRSARAGLLITSHGFVNVSALVRALMHAARLSGAVAVTPTEIIHVEQRRDVVHVRVDDRVEEFDHVVIAAGSWSRRVRVAGLPVFPVKPIRGQLLHLRWTGAVRPAQSIWGTRCYTVPWADGSLLVGATVEDVGFDERSTVSGVRELLDAVVELLPESAVASLDAVRVGLRPATTDHLPLVGPLKHHSRVVIAAGHYRNGILLAPLTADIVARLILDGDRDPVLDQLDPGR